MTDQANVQSDAAVSNAAPTTDSLAALFKESLFGGQPQGQAPTNEGEKAQAESGESPEEVGELTDEQVLDRFKVPALEGDGIEELTAEELKAQRLMQADYTRKTQQIAEERKAVQAERQKVEAEIAARAQAMEHQLQMLGRAIQSFDQQVDWDALRQVDPGAYLEAREQQQARLQAFEQSRQQIMQVQQAQRAERIAQSSQRLVEAMPELLDPQTAKKFAEKIVGGAGDAYGFSPQEIDALDDHRLILMARDAIAYRELKAKTQAIKPKVEAAPQLAKPGAPRPGNPDALRTHRLVQKATAEPSRENLRNLFLQGLK
jgi:hypothetical protein